SEKYPVMNSINYLASRSMATYLNAITEPTMTSYPVATVNGQDLLNLASVYLDAVFHPLLLSSREGFDREGWHYSMESKDSQLNFGGVVLNEMKGVYSNPRAAGARYLSRDLYANSSFAYDSGGDPSVIPSLLYEDAVDFYYK